MIVGVIFQKEKRWATYSTMAFLGAQREGVWRGGENEKEYPFRHDCIFASDYVLVSLSLFVFLHSHSHRRLPLHAYVVC